MDERWAPVPGYENRYEVSDRGRIRSLRLGRILNPRDSHGYKRVVLYTGSKKSARTFGIHRLVALAFLGPAPFPGAEINHKNEVRDDNRPENLEWCDRFYNMNYGSCRTNRLKPVGQYSQSGALLSIFESCKTAALRTGTHQGAISNACLGRAKTAGGYKWRYLENE